MCYVLQQAQTKPTATREQTAENPDSTRKDQLRGMLRSWTVATSGAGPTFDLPGLVCDPPSILNKRESKYCRSVRRRRKGSKEGLELRRRFPVVDMSKV
jgi:hypothetical protein